MGEREHKQENKTKHCNSGGHLTYKMLKKHPSIKPGLHSFASVPPTMVCSGMKTSPLTLDLAEPSPAEGLQA